MKAVILTLLLAAGLLAAPIALADGETGRARADAARAQAAEARATHAPDHADNDTDDDANDTTRGRPDNATEGRPAFVTAFLDQMKAIRTSWLENATKVRETCRAAEIDHENATQDERTAHAQCIRDGYRGLRASYAADLKALREELRAMAESRRGDHGQDA